MAPVATKSGSEHHEIKNLKQEVGQLSNPFYSPAGEDDNDETYQYSHLKPYFPNVDWEPLEELPVVDRGKFADPEKKALFSAATKVRQLTPTIGCEILGVDLRELSNAQKDELALLVAERGVVFFRNQEINIHEQLELARYFGPLHTHPTTPVPREPGLEEVHVVYYDSASKRPDPSSFSKLELFHSDVTFELQPPGVTSLKLYTSPEVGGDTLWSSGYALYSSLSSGFQRYLEGLSAVHSAAAQAQGARAAGLHVRRQEIETVHPVVRVHPTTGWKSVYVNPGFTRRIIGVPKAESDNVLQFLYSQISQNPDFQVRFKWETNDIAFWDNRVVFHSAIFDFWPSRRHALRATPHGERPLSVEAYEQESGKKAKDRQLDLWQKQGVEFPVALTSNGPRGYND
ncbi:TauD-domain-containing protein [Ramaria rubella]|nr:TauD-domain-containing protein [Ramaria rubella]